ncbi:hypothetical protein [Nocardioides panaciterrulae]|uniref:Uncharacterized protein n=1 Tax=Nocardioides panaciterrulae TaxID=661492 RepID=A0A7Y9E5V7_9ACTN|nr:hypothetical protein [Nocardioides panaciterrulae]NYD41416.1 hypothetical protein [Nocardioides panaciterrulae]
MSNQTTSEGVMRAHRGAPGADTAATAPGVADLHRILLETAFELTAEFDGLPAGSVMRCFGRSVKLARAQGATGPGLPEAARRIAASSLRKRAAGGRHPVWTLAATA